MPPPPPPPPPATSKSKLGRGSTTPFPSLFERPFAWASPLTRSVPNSPPFFLSFFLACPSRSSSDLVPKRGEESCRSLAPPPHSSVRYDAMGAGAQREEHGHTHTHEEGVVGRRRRRRRGRTGTRRRSATTVHLSSLTWTLPPPPPPDGVH